MRRARRFRRSEERGAAVFVVVLAITLVTAVGLFAAHSATMVDQAAGYARMARQTQYLAEYGTLAAAAELGSGTAGAYLDEMKAGRNSCRANAGVLGAPCYKMSYADLNARTEQLNGEPLTVDESGSREGRIGYAPTTDEGIVGAFVVELTDAGPTGAPVAGTDLSGTGGSRFRYVKVTATTLAQVRPPGDVCRNDIASVTGQQALRAHLVVGPIPE